MDPRNLHKQSGRVGPTRRAIQGRSGRRDPHFFWDRSGWFDAAQCHSVQFYASGCGIGLHGFCELEMCDGDELPKGRECHTTR